MNNCNTCKHFLGNRSSQAFYHQVETIASESTGLYAVECKVIIHPLEDCVLHNFICYDENKETSTINFNDL